MRQLGAAILLLGAACAHKPDLSAMTEPLFTGAPCDAQRLRADYGTGWREVRGSGFTYCVPPNFVSKGGDGKYWENKFLRFSWGDDPRVNDGSSLVVFQIGNGRDVPDPNENRIYTEVVDGKQVRMSVNKLKGEFRISCVFESTEVKYYARSSSNGTTNMLAAVCLSVRFTR